MDLADVEPVLRCVAVAARRPGDDDERDALVEVADELRERVAAGQAGLAWVAYGRVAIAFDRRLPNSNTVLTALRVALGGSDDVVAAALCAHHQRRDTIGYEVDRGRMVAGTLIRHRDVGAALGVTRAWLAAVAVSGHPGDGAAAGRAAVTAMVRDGQIDEYEAADFVGDRLAALLGNLDRRDMTPTYFFDVSGAHRYDPARRAVRDRWEVFTVPSAGGGPGRRLVSVLRGPACLSEFSTLFRAGRVEASITEEIVTCAARLWDPTGRGPLINPDECLEVAAMISPDIAAVRLPAC